MHLAHRPRYVLAALAASAFVAFALPLHAQEISELHLKAARAAIDAANVTDPYDAILPRTAQGIKQELIQQNPDLQELISTTVDEKALAMASRRADLEREAALAYARVFSEQELNEVAAFYNTETGKKLLTNGPNVSREVIKAADIWQRGIARDLADAVNTELEKVVGAQAAPIPAPAGDAPAPAGDAPAPAAAPAQ